MEAAVALEPMKPPFTQLENGAIRITGTRVSLESLVYAFEEGCSPEEIVLQYPTLNLPDVYTTIAFILANPTWKAEYMKASERATEATIAEIDRRMPKALREKLLAAREAQR